MELAELCFKAVDARLIVTISLKGVAAGGVVPAGALAKLRAGAGESGDGWRKAMTRSLKDEMNARVEDVQAMACSLVELTWGKTILNMCYVTPAEGVAWS